MVPHWTIEDLSLVSLGLSLGEKWLFSQDLSSFFFQIPISERSGRVTAFYLLDRGIFEWTVCPMGISVSPKFCQAVTDRLCRLMRRVIGFIDDYLGYGGTLDEIFLSMEDFCAVMSMFNLVVGPAKTVLPTRKINFLGYTISRGQIHRIQSNKISDLRDIKSPTTKDQLKSILGLFSWYSSKAMLRDISEGMRELGKSNMRFKWTPELERDLRGAIEILLDPITGCLRTPITPSSDHPFVLFTDSSRSAFGGVLSQIQEVSEGEIAMEGVKAGDRRLYLCEYFAKSIKGDQKLTPIALLELESLFLSLKHWKNFCLVTDSKVIVYTDSRYVSYFSSLELCSEKVARMLCYISEFSIELRFLPSELNQSDVLSRSLGAGEPLPNQRNPFHRMVIRNGKGEVIPPEKLFSRDKREELNKFFLEHKRGGLAQMGGVNEAVDNIHYSMGPGPVVKMFPGRSGRRSPPPQRGMKGGDTYLEVAGSSFGPCRDFPGGGHSGFLRKSDKCVRAGVLGGAWRRGPGHANGLGLGLGHCNPLLKYSAGGGHSDFLRKSCKCVQAVSGALSLRDGMEAPRTLLLEERAKFLSGNFGTDSINGLLEGGLPFEVVESVGTPLVRAGGVSSPRGGRVVVSEVEAGLADGGDGSLIGWLGPITDFPKLLILGEETGEGGGCRRRGRVGLRGGKGGSYR